ncbi:MULTISPECIES: PHB depolymerase family esterase [unclassified Rhizobium]|uniref:extracellular catalytic domain type 1 short-chain-length polyhydroxyalkanoate depolymerase n=1 Tax=unclassified Rhizobium TaxID=2613769 RepID=UPI001A998C5B|nr:MULTISPECIES: PHB depolymerase family esterase [unclassified Rhizobium]MBX5158873.1 PHB depolymerase family esterase [Rhizobium sp. NZLR8]MBX5166680.1 PHB depolymerase family esterase [Rhizobium sp. NZLR4b]MBX5171306.1 PHB depolymerase family esterase [Rhizobium sp. NZLR1b]MBX5182316.1 PHB depolymerase family esterase [Rhizobium sp. NZLR5]MBX5190263.1 PHB depolymerase family esterase [Rhizobium sp. NZLR3b]
MRSMSDTLARLAALRGTLRPQPTQDNSDLVALEAFGANPGALGGHTYLPTKRGKNMALVVVLHGCIQTAAGYDIGSGWSRLAEDYGFALLFPEQRRANNPNLCFNWFNPEDTRRDHGEVSSIRQMIAKLVAEHGIDSRRVFVTGLSAGGAMAAAMLATYPEVFAGGAIIAGLPYASAATIPEAFDRMRGHGGPTAEELELRLRSASGHKGPWPTLSLWQGTADRTVVPANANAIVEQWRNIHSVDASPSRVEDIGRHQRRVWTDAHGVEVIELYTIAGMDHGTPLDVGTGYGASGPFMLDVGISSTVEIARSWGLVPSFEKRLVAKSSAAQPENATAPFAAESDRGGIQKVIEDALRSAGLLR